MASSLTICSRLCRSFQNLRLEQITNQTRSYYVDPKYKPPKWFVKKERVASEDMLTLENRQFVEEVTRDKFSAVVSVASPLQAAPSPAVPWDPRTRRTGLIARKIGNYPLWLKDGKKVQTTLLQVIDNHVVKYIPPEEFRPMKTAKVNWREKRTLGCLLVGAESVDPGSVTKEYSGLFRGAGVLPKRHLRRFLISPHAAPPPATPLLVTHFRVGDVLDVRGKTTDRGFQGVMKRWGFKGMPASHGVTKTHRRGGNIGAGGEKARVWPGTKMPGHMGNRWRTLRGVKVLRVDARHNVLWLLGVALPGETGAVCSLYDSVLPRRRPPVAAPPPCPTHAPALDDPPETLDASVHPFHAPTITFAEA